MAFSPDGSELCVVGYGKSIEVWDLSRFVRKRSIQTGSTTFDRFREPRVVQVVYSADGESVIVAEGGIPRRYRVATGELLNEYLVSRVTESNTRSLAMAEDGSLLASLHSRDIRIWDPDTGELAKEISLKGYAEDRRDLQVAGNGSLVSACVDGEALIWDTTTGRIIYRLPGSVMELSTDGRTAITGTDDGAVRIWDVKSQAELHSLFFEGPIRSVSVGSDGSLLIVEVDGAVHLFDAVAESP
jgi:WD40 repeat protein